MNTTKIENIPVKGIAVRTDNSSEINPSTAKIGPLWERFYTEFAPLLSENSRVFGLYTNYESDHTGAFDVVACTDLLDSQSIDSFAIQAGNYVVFKGQGKMPDAVINLWGQVWEYFESATCKHVRAFTTDFEFYKNDNEVEIYIAI